LGSSVGAPSRFRDAGIGRIVYDCAVSQPPVVDGPARTDRRLPEVDAALARLAARKDDWVRVGLAARIEYLRRSIAGILTVAGEWVDEACRHRGIDPDSPLAGEEWLSGPMATVQGLHQLMRSLKAGGHPEPPAINPGPNGQPIVKVFPTNLIDRFLYYNIASEVWIEPGRPPSQGRIYREKEAGLFSPGKVALVLGAGNISSIPPLDVAYKLFVEDQIAVLKMNPVNAYLGPYLERAFESLIEDGFLAVVYGGREAGEYLCRHPKVDTIHLTGSDRTHDAIVWGADPEEQARRKAENRPVIDKPISSELGCVSPVMIVPGRWSNAEMRFQARQIAAMVAHNVSFDCNSGKALILAQGWSQRETFIDHVKAALAAVPTRKAYYPGAHERYEEYRRRYPQAIPLAEAGADAIPWTLIPDVPAAKGEYALTYEAFCPVLAEVTLAGSEPAEFIDRAVDFVNDEVWGNLSCNLFVDPRTQRAQRNAVERAIERLRYGTVAVNTWAAVSYCFPGASWGAYPGNTLEDIQSGIGVVHNALLLDHPQKTVTRSPFRIWPKPVWFADHRTLKTLGRQLTHFEATRSPRWLAAVTLSGIAG